VSFDWKFIGQINLQVDRLFTGSIPARIATSSEMNIQTLNSSAMRIFGLNC